MSVCVCAGGRWAFAAIVFIVLLYMTGCDGCWEYVVFEFLEARICSFRGEPEGLLVILHTIHDWLWV